MSVTHTSAVERFAWAASEFCAWATSPVVQGENDAELAVDAFHLYSPLVARWDGEKASRQISYDRLMGLKRCG